MKKNIHPKYYKNAKIVCACGNEFIVGSTVENMKIEICSSCHPFYTKTGNLIDKAGRVDKYKARLEKFEKIQEDKFKKLHQKTRKQKQAEELLKTRKK